MEQPICRECNVPMDFYYNCTSRGKHYNLTGEKELQYEVYRCELCHRIIKITFKHEII